MPPSSWDNCVLYLRFLIFRAKNSMVSATHYEHAHDHFKLQIPVYSLDHPALPFSYSHSGYEPLREFTSVQGQIYTIDLATDTPKLEP